MRFLEDSTGDKGGGGRPEPIWALINHSTSGFYTNLTIATYLKLNKNFTYKTIELLFNYLFILLFIYHFYIILDNNNECLKFFVIIFDNENGGLKHIFNNQMMESKLILFYKCQKYQIKFLSIFLFIYTVAVND